MKHAFWMLVAKWGGVQFKKINKQIKPKHIKIPQKKVISFHFHLSTRSSMEQ